MSVSSQLGLRHGLLNSQFKLALAALCLSCIASAATFSGLYTVNVALLSDPGLTQIEATRIAMGQLLTRITGRPDAAQELIFLNLLDQAGDFVLEVGKLDRDTLTVTFDALSIVRELRTLDQPVWGPERPLTLMWVAVDAGFGQRGILSAQFPEAHNEPVIAELKDRLRQKLFNVADVRGLPVTLPLLDLEDMASLSFADIWGGFNDRIRKASARYHADAILSGRVRVTAFGTNVQWTLIRGDKERGITTATLGEGLDRLAEIYAEDFGAIGKPRTVQIVVLDINERSHYFNALSYMNSLSLLESVRVVQFGPDGLLLRVTWRGDLGVFERMLSLDNVLTPVITTRSSNNPGVETRLTFRLVH